MDVTSSETILKKNSNEKLVKINNSSIGIFEYSSCNISRLKML